MVTRWSGPRLLVTRGRLPRLLVTRGRLPRLLGLKYYSNVRTPMETRGGNAEVPEFPQKTGETSPSYHLKRLLAVNDTNYSRDFKYDEFGNMAVSAYAGIAAVGLTPQIGGSRPNPYDPGTNRLLSAGYDTRGDMTALGTTTMTYDAEGRQVSTTDSGVGGQSISYAFDAEGQRVAKQVAGGATVIDVHDAFGRLAVEYSSASLTAACNTCYLAYDGLGSVRLITDENGALVARHDYLPYGEEIPDGTAGRSGKFGYSSNVRQGFTGQELDGATATMSSGTAELEYFNARHMSAALGSFTQPDPMQAGADFLNPQSWNGYAYVLGNPISNADPSGACTVVFGGVTQSRDPSSGITSIARGLSAVDAYPYAGLDVVTSSLHVFVQGFLPTINTLVAQDALRFALSANTGKIDVVAYSGGAGAFTAAYNRLSSSDQQRIGSILYLSPGSSGSLEINGTTSIVRGSGPVDIGAMLGTGYPIGTPVEQTDCWHRDVACLSNTATAIKSFNAMEANGPCTSQMTFSFHWPGTAVAPGSGGNGGGGGIWSGPGISWSTVTIGTVDQVPVVTSTVSFQ